MFASFAGRKPSNGKAKQRCRPGTERQDDGTLAGA
jgi:hypothetical protein